MLTADYELYPDDSRYSYRRALREGFRSFGFKPGSEAPGERVERGLWEGPGALPCSITGRIRTRCSKTRMRSFASFGRIGTALQIDENAYTKVEAVWPCYRVASDGFFLRETVAVYSQRINLDARELRQLGLKKPREMPDDLELTIYGGGTLIFDESGRLKYHVRNRIRNANRQNPRLQYLWGQGSLTGRKSFAALHLERVLRHDLDCFAGQSRGGG